MRAAVLVLLTLAASCAPTGRDGDATSSARPPRIVSLNPCSDAVLAKVASHEQLLAISHYSHDPASSSMDLAAARSFPSVSGSVEEIAALAPDVVVAGTFLAPTTEAALRDLGIRVVKIGIAATVAESEAQVRELATLAGGPARGEALIAEMERALAEAAPPPAQPVPAIVWQSGGIVAGDSSLVADLLRRTGFANAAAARGLSQADYLPLERVVADPPRVLIVAGDEMSEEDRSLRHPALVDLPGMARARLDSSLLWCGGPTVIRAARRLAEIRRLAGAGGAS